MEMDGKSANGKAEDRKLSTTRELETSPKRLRNGKKRSDDTQQTQVLKGISDDDEKKSKIDNGKDKKRKLVNEADGSEKPSKRRLLGDTENAGETVTELMDLPGELLVKIIDMVPISQWASLELVSHPFRNVVHGLWGQQRQIRLKEFVYNEEKKPNQIVEAILKKFLIRAPNVASISGFDVFFNRRTKILLETSQLLSEFEHLLTVDFSGERVMTANEFASFLESSASRQSWKTLDILDGIYGKMSRKAVGSKNQPALKLECFKFSINSLRIFGRFLPPIEWSRLKKLVVAFSFKSAKDVLWVIRQCNQISHLDIMVPKCGNGNGQPSYAEFMQGVADLENLTVLKIFSDGSSPFHDALLGLIRDLDRRGITKLALRDSEICSDQIIGAIIDHLPRLRSLELHVEHCTSASLERLANRMGQLESLTFESLPSLSVDGTVIRAVVGNMSGLQRLHLDHISGVDSEAINILGELRKLKELRITCKMVKHGTIEAWTRLGFGSCLETLELYLNRGFPPEAMVDFLKNTPRLRWMNLNGDATDPILYSIAESCPNLAELELSPLSITSDAIQCVIDRCSQLKILSVYGHFGWFPERLTVGKYRKITFKARVWGE